MTHHSHFFSYIWNDFILVKFSNDILDIHITLSLVIDAIPVFVPYLQVGVLLSRNTHISILHLTLILFWSCNIGNTTIKIISIFKSCVKYIHPSIHVVASNIFTKVLTNIWITWLSIYLFKKQIPISLQYFHVGVDKYF